MLRFLRKRKVMKRITLVLASLIVPAFILWGVSSAFLNRGPSAYAGTMFGQRVPFDDFLEAWSLARDYTNRTFGEDVAPEFVDDFAWNRLMLLHEAKAMKLKVSNEEVTAQIALIPQFQRDGQFDSWYYHRILGPNAREFEEAIRHDALIEKLRHLVIANVIISDDELWQLFQERRETAMVEGVFVDPQPYVEAVQFTEPEVMKFYDERRESWTIPAQVDVDYVAVLFEDLEDEVSLTEENVQEFYENQLDEILGTDTAEEASTEISSDETIAGTDSADELQSDPERPPFEEVRERIVEHLTLQKSHELARRRIEDVEVEYFQQDGLAQAAEVLGLTVVNSGPFAQNDEIFGVGWSFHFSREAFQLKRDDLSDIIETPRGYYLFTLVKRDQPRIPSLVEVRSQVEEGLKLLLAKELALEAAVSLKTAMSDRISQGASFSDAAAALGHELIAIGPFRREGYIPIVGLSQDFAQATFSLDTDTLSDPIQTERGPFVIRLIEMTLADRSVFDAQREEFRVAALQQREQETYNRWLEDVKQRAALEKEPIDLEALP